MRGRGKGRSMVIYGNSGCVRKGMYGEGVREAVRYVWEQWMCGEGGREAVRYLREQWV